MATTLSDSKNASREQHIDRIGSADNSVMEGRDEKKMADEERDYTGTGKKTDPEEIALVRKLDYRIMPTLCVMYFRESPYLYDPRVHPLSLFFEPI